MISATQTRDHNLKNHPYLGFVEVARLSANYIRFGFKLFRNTVHGMLGTMHLDCSSIRLAENRSQLLRIGVRGAKP